MEKRSLKMHKKQCDENAYLSISPAHNKIVSVLYPIEEQQHEFLLYNEMYIQVYSELQI